MNDEIDRFSMDYFRLDGKVAIVTGANMGLGMAYAAAFAKAGADLYIPHFTGDVAEITEIVETEGRKVAFLQGDLTDSEYMDRIVADCLSTYGGIDILVNNAGMSKFGDFETYADEDYRRCIELDLNASYFLGRRVALVMMKQGNDLCTSVVAQALVYEYCHLGHLDGFLPKILKHYSVKRDGMAEAFRKHLPVEAEYHVPAGGFFFWMRLPGVDTKELFLKAVDRGVAFVTGPSFFANGGGEDCLRLCFSFAQPEELEEGAKRLAAAIGDLKG